MSLKRFKVKITGTTPLMHHRMTEDDLAALLGDKAAKKKAKETLTPREIAARHVYQFPDGTCYIPSGYISGAFLHVASDYKQKNSQRKSYKAIAGGIFRPEQESAPLLDETGQPLKSWEVDIRKATNHKAGAVAVCRPRFERWACEFTCSVHTDLITPETVLDILNDAGMRSGIGSFRVAKGGYFGQFQVTSFAPIQ